MFSPKTILVPTDFSRSSDNALEKALDLADTYHARVILLHVIDEDIQQCAADYCLNNEDVSRLEEENVKKSREQMEIEVNRLIGKRGVEVQYDLQKGSPVGVILNEQDTTNTDLIVIGSHGRGGIKKHLIGGVADKIVRSARSPVMVVHA